MSACSLTEEVTEGRKKAMNACLFGVAIYILAR